MIKKAALATAGAAVASTVIGEKVIPRSSAARKRRLSPNSCPVIARCVLVEQGVFVDTTGCCNGSYPCYCAPSALFFGQSVCTVTPGSAIGSQRNNNARYVCCCPCKPLIKVPPGNNLYGLDFYTDCKKRVSITQSGSVGIGTCTPSSTLEVVSTTSCAVNGTSACGHGVSGNSSKGTGVFGASPNKYGVHGCSTCNTGVLGTGKNFGVSGCSAGGYAIFGCSSSNVGVWGSGKVSGVHGYSPSGTGVLASIGSGAGIPLIAKGQSSQTGNLMQFEKGCTTVSAFNPCGWLGIGTATPKTALEVNGGISAKVATPTSAYTMGVTDFAVLATADVILPSAASAVGRIVFVKNISATSISVTANGTDKIEGKGSENLSKQYKSLILISDGVKNWYIFSNAT